jgi:hypothetical protein
VIADTVSLGDQRVAEGPGARSDESDESDVAAERSCGRVVDETVSTELVVQVSTH